MRDFSINLPSWAVRRGYRLEGGGGTYDDLYLYKDGETIKVWWSTNKVPNIFEMEEIINGFESEKVASGCPTTF